MAKKQVIVLIDDCRKCPYCGAADKGFYCSQLKNYITPKPGEIPDECPRPDLEKIERNLGIEKHATRPFYGF